MIWCHSLRNIYFAVHCIKAVITSQVNLMHIACNLKYLKHFMFLNVHSNNLNIYNNAQSETDSHSEQTFIAITFYKMLFRTYRSCVY